MILVGVDGSQAALEAVSWAVREARLRDAGLRIVHVMPAWPLEMSEDAPYADAGRWMRDGAASMLTAAVERAREEDDRVNVESLLLPGDPRLVLIEAAKEADLLVVGSHGLGGFSGMLLGSVAHRIRLRRGVPARRRSAGGSRLEPAHRRLRPLCPGVRAGDGRRRAASAGRGAGGLERALSGCQGHRAGGVHAPGGGPEERLSARRPAGCGITRTRRPRRVAAGLGQPRAAAPCRLPADRDIRFGDAPAHLIR